MINSKYSIFIDENLKTKQIGGLVVDNPHILIESIIGLKNKYHNYDEIKYTELSKYNIEFCKSIINLLGIYKFNYYIMDFDKIKIFSYEDFVGKIISEYDNMYVFLDYFSNSGGIYIEDLLYNKINKVQYAIRQDSKSNILIQITDLLLGLFTRDSNNIESIYKKELVQYANSSKIKDKIIFLKNKKK